VVRLDQMLQLFARQRAELRPENALAFGVDLVRVEHDAQLHRGTQLRRTRRL